MAPDKAQQEPNGGRDRDASRSEEPAEEERSPWPERRELSGSRPGGAREYGASERFHESPPREPRHTPRPGSFHTSPGYAAGMQRTSRVDPERYVRDQRAPIVGDRLSRTPRPFDEQFAEDRAYAPPPEGYAGRGPRGYHKPDARIHEQICEAMTDDDSLDASDVEVAVERHEVILSGTVPNRAMKKHAEAIAETIPGVEDVHNQLRIAHS